MAKKHHFMIALAFLAGSICVTFTTPQAKADDGKNRRLRVIPVVFVGAAADCGTPLPGSNIVTSAWLPGLGLPDDTTSLNTPSQDPHFGLLLNKNGPTPDCSSAGAIIDGVQGQTVTQLGFDFRNGTHCGAGAPRFNLVTSDNLLHFGGGCANGTQTPAPQDPAEWTRVRIDPANPVQMFPPVAAGATIKSLSIIFDEGTDTPTLQDPMGVGLSTLDNIDVNGMLVGSGRGIAPNTGSDRGRGDD